MNPTQNPWPDSPPSTPEASYVVTTADFTDPLGLPVDGAGPLAAVCVDAHG